MLDQLHHNTHTKNNYTPSSNNTYSKSTNTYTDPPSSMSNINATTTTPLAGSGLNTSFSPMRHSTTSPIGAATGGLPNTTMPLAGGAASNLPVGQSPLHQSTAAPIGTAPAGASPLGLAPLAGTTASTMLPATGAGLMGHNDHHLSKQERKALKHQNKALKHGHHHSGMTGTGLPLAGGAATGTGLGAGQMRGATTSVVEHQPIVEREVVVERPVEVRHEHHIQPVIHEREHRIQPIVKTQTTTERRVIEQDRTTMLPPIVETPLMGAALTGTTGLSAHQPLAGGAHHGGVGALDAERRLSTTAGATTMPGERYGTTGTTTTTGHHATVGQKLKGTAKEVAGAITRNPAKKEEGRMLKHGADPALATTSHPTSTRI